MNTVTPSHLKFAILAADTTLFTIQDGELMIRLIRVKRPPHFPDNPGLPGGLMHPKETADETAKRHVEEKTGVSAKKLYVEQFHTFSAIDRDPRGRVVAVAYIALIPYESLSKEERSNGDESYWIPVKKASHLAYDHDHILKTALAYLRSRSKASTIIKKLMPEQFTLTELEQAYESILGTDLDKRNFRKKMLKLDILTSLQKKRAGGPFRPAALYRFATRTVDDIGIL